MKKNLHQKIFIIYFSIAALTFSCSMNQPTPTAEIDYIKAYKLLKDKDYTESAKAFEKIEDDYPFSKWAQKSQVMAAYCYYKQEEYENLNRIVDDFTRISPNSEYTSYMLYIKGLGFYNKIPNIYRSQDSTRESSKIFREIIARFPQSIYIDDVKNKIIFIDEHLAGYKMSLGRYQQKNENYIGAIQNFQEVTWRFKRTNQVAEAYFRLFEIYEKLGIKIESAKALNILEKDFLNNFWTKEATKIKNSKR